MTIKGDSMMKDLYTTYDNNDKSEINELHEQVIQDELHDQDNVYVITNTRVNNNKKKYSICTLIIMAANFLIFALCYGVDNYEISGGANYEYIFELGEYGRLISSMFLHGGAAHLLFNMMALYVFGKAVEDEIGSLNFVGIYFSSGILAGIISVVVKHVIDPNDLVISIGASGAIYGIIGARVFLYNKLKNSPLISSISKVVVYAIIEYMIQKSSNIDLVAHLGGAVVGSLVTFYIYTKYNNSPKITKNKTIIAIAITLVFSIIGGLEANIGEEPQRLNKEIIESLSRATIEYYPKATIGEILNNSFENGEWDTYVDDNGNTIVEFSGMYQYDGKSTYTKIEYIFIEESSEFKFNNIYIDGVIPDKEEGYKIIAKIFGPYR